MYDLLGAGAVEFIISHAEVSIAFVEEKKIPEVNAYLKLSIILLFQGIKNCVIQISITSKPYLYLLLKLFSC